MGAEGSGVWAVVPCEAGDVMEDLLGKGKWHPCQKEKDKKASIVNPCIGYFRFYGQYFPVTPFSRSGRRRY